ncbi:hypothetical protein PBY51_021396 [Eleginops maclovinus]|uniref:Uncharacterized protein n=1 Tax=Eleginops maclovinus TaxID=56733 RepID=A0AAN7X904_ELEMC|nr:hypothetical protein PBY51_021396 [Eleginops maclovinus]
MLQVLECCQGSYGPWGSIKAICPVWWVLQPNEKGVHLPGFVTFPSHQKTKNKEAIYILMLHREELRGLPAHFILDDPCIQYTPIGNPFICNSKKITLELFQLLITRLVPWSQNSGG